MRGALTELRGGVAAERIDDAGGCDGQRMVRAERQVDARGRRRSVVVVTRLVVNESPIWPLAPRPQSRSVLSVPMAPE